MDLTAALKRSWRQRLAFATVGAVFVALAAAFVGAAFEANAAAELSRRAQTEAHLRAASLRSELEQLRDFPTILANDPDVRRVLETPRSSGSVQGLSSRLEQLTNQTRARFIYLIAENGLTLSSSNWRTPESFVGQDYSFRPYFREALADGEAEYFALGTVTGEPGLYIARRVTSPRGGLGVVVVKVLFDDVEAQWSQTDERIIVTDAQGIAILSTDARWRFRATRPLPEDTAEAIRQTRQFGDAPDLSPLPIPGTSADDAEFALATVPVPNSDWLLLLMAPARSARENAANVGRLIGGLAAALVFGLAWLSYSTWRRTQREKRDQQRARAELERQVSDRTGELETSNRQLQLEMAERKRAETNLHLLQDELIQANKLAVLGQISAGVAHEINQPLAAIKTFADNAKRLIERAEPREANENLATISSLADRIASITDELRSMARKGTGPRERVRLVDAIEGALLLVSARVRALGANIVRDYAAPDAHVIAHRMRVEQVVLNLLQNALDAIAEHPAPTIRISVRENPESTLVSIEDNGPGLAPAAMQNLFTPFHTTKPQGLGLGLVISQDICREYGGRLAASNAALGGAGFTIHMPVARDV